MSDFIAGASVGIAQVAIGHPFDTCMVLIQNGRKWRNLPFKNYYKGWKFPLVSATLFNCVVFSTYERSLKYTNNRVFSGAICGLCIAPLLYGFEIGKIRRQTNQSLKLSHFKNSKGFYPLLTRETLAMSTYFTTYHYAKDYGYQPLVAGGMAGLANWGLTYPIDVIKSRQMAQNLSIKDAIKKGNFYKGFSICGTRAVLVNAVNFWTYEKAKGYIDSKIN